MEERPSNLDKLIWRVFRAETMGRAVSTMVFAVLLGCVLTIVVTPLYYLDSRNSSSESSPGFLWSFFFPILTLVLAQIAACLSRLVYDSQRGLSRLLQLVAVLVTVSMLVLLAVTIVL